MQLLRTNVFVLVGTLFVGPTGAKKDNVPGDRPNYHFPAQVDCQLDYIPGKLDKLILSQNQLEEMVKGKLTGYQSENDHFYRAFETFQGHEVELLFRVTRCPQNNNNAISFLEVRTSHGTCVRGDMVDRGEGQTVCDIWTNEPHHGHGKRDLPPIQHPGPGDENVLDTRSIVARAAAVSNRNIPGAKPNLHFPYEIACWKNRASAPREVFMVTLEQLEHIVKGKVVQSGDSHQYKGVGMISGVGVEVHFTVESCPKQKNNAITYTEAVTRRGGKCKVGQWFKPDPTLLAESKMGACDWGIAPCKWDPQSDCLVAT